MSEYELELSEIDLVEIESHGRGFERGMSDRDESPFPNPEPLTGEWAGESVRELLGDLIDALVRLGVDESDAFDALCDAYEEGYRQGFGPHPETLGDHACSLCGSDYNGPAGGLCEMCESGQIDAGESE